jgi:glutamate synthase (ferredoxin)
MTGGLAWVYDEDGTFVSGQRYHPEFIAAEQFRFANVESQANLKALIETHVERSGSGLGRSMLEDWPKRAEAFVRLTPVPQA